MKDVEEFLNRVCQDLSTPSSLRSHLREEVRSHLEEAIARHEAEGASPEEAVRLAIDEFGDPADVRDELQGVYGRRLVSLMIERAMEWKVKTMTTEWKWSFAGELALLLVIAAQFVLIAAIAVFILPIVTEHYVNIQVDAPPYLVGMTKVLGFFSGTWYLWLSLIVFGIVFFEWRGPKEGKPVMRLGISAAVSLVLTVAALAVTAGTMIPLVQAARESDRVEQEAVVSDVVDQAGTLYTQLSREYEIGD